MVCRAVNRPPLICYLEYHEAQYWGLCSSYYLSTIYQSQLNPMPDCSQMTACCFDQYEIIGIDRFCRSLCSKRLCGTLSNAFETSRSIMSTCSPVTSCPVSLTSIICKLMEHIMHSQVMDHLDEHSILCDNQHGFRSKRSCETQLIITIEEIARKVATREQVDIILLDYRCSPPVIRDGSIVERKLKYASEY
jgi:hypothetical protein